MEEYEDNINRFLDDIDIEEDLDKDADTFLKCATFNCWYKWAIGGSLYKNVFAYENYNDAVELTTAQICDRIHAGRMSLVNGVNILIDYHLEEENYELIPKLKEHCEKLHREGLELEMRVERFL